MEFTNDFISLIGDFLKCPVIKVGNVLMSFSFWSLPYSLSLPPPLRSCQTSVVGHFKEFVLNVSVPTGQ